MTDGFDVTFDGESPVVNNELDGYKGQLPLNAKITPPVTLMLTDNRCDVVITITKRDGIIIVKVFSGSAHGVRLETNCPIGSGSESSGLPESAKTSPEELGF